MVSSASLKGRYFVLTLAFSSFPRPSVKRLKPLPSPRGPILLNHLQFSVTAVLIQALAADVKHLGRTIRLRAELQRRGPIGVPVQEGSIGRAIKQEIREHLRLVASVGVAPNKFLAKIASDLRKPDGFVVVEPDQVQEFLDPLPVGRLWGVGKVTGQVFEKLGIHRISQLRQMPVELLRHHFGSGGEHLWELSHGFDDRPVVPEQEAKSISHETTFAKDLEDPEQMRAWLLELSEQVGCRMRRHGLKGRTVNLKVRFEDFHTITRAQTLPQPTNVTQEIWQTADQMFAERLPARRLHIRLLGVGMSGFDQPAMVQLSLFPEAEHERQSRLDEVADRIKEKFGQAGLQRALGMLHNVEHRSGPPGADQNQYGR